MKRLFFIVIAVIACINTFAQNDPVIMTINGKPILRSEFEYSYNKNNTDGVIDKKDIREYVDLFVNYKLKVEAAYTAGLDTMESFKKEFLSYRNQQIRPTFITNQDLEDAALKIYNDTRHRIDNNGGLVNVSHILISNDQMKTQESIDAARLKSYSIYKALLNGSSWEELARTYSSDQRSAYQEGKLGWIQKGMTVKEFEEVAFSSKIGEINAPIETPYGFHIIKVNDKRTFYPFEDVRDDIIKFIEQRGLRESIIDEKLAKISEERGGISIDSLLNEQTKKLEANDLSLRYLNKEYLEGPLLFEISTREVWDKASKDEQALANYFAKNKKRYKWDEPRFKGMVYHVRDAKDIKAVKNSVKGLSFDKWAERLRSTFNSDSVHRIRVEKGLFKKGDNGYIDKMVFKVKDATIKPTLDYPIDSHFGKTIKSPEDYTDVRPLVVADYQEELEKAWIDELRKRFTVEINYDVVDTVNNH